MTYLKASRKFTKLETFADSYCFSMPNHYVVLSKATHSFRRALQVRRELIAEYAKAN